MPADVQASVAIRPSEPARMPQVIQTYRCAELWPQVLYWILSWACLFGLYLLLAGQASGEELVAAALTATAAIGSGVLVRKLGGQRTYRARLGWLRRAAAPLRALAVDLVLVGGALLRALGGQIEMGTVMPQPFDDRRNSPRDAARRGLVVLAASFAPNTVALGIAPRRLMLHQLVRRPPSPDREWPI